MRLFTFAHRGEAIEFIKRDHYNPVPFFFPGLYQNDENSFLLITGEGIQSTSQKLSAVCASLNGKIQRVSNIGVAGSLDPSLQLGEIHKIRTVYLEHGHEEPGNAAFHSFTCQNDSPRLDCLTARSRLLEPSRAQKLSCFAQIVDMELWATASVCHLFQLPLDSTKLLVDSPLEIDGTRCEQVQFHSLEYSQKLYDFIQIDNLKTNSPQLEIEQIAKHELFSLSEILPGFYFSTTQKRQLIGLLHSLSCKDQIPALTVLQKIDWFKIQKTIPHPKKRTQKLLQELQSLLTPFYTQLKNKLDLLCFPLTKAKCQVQFAPDFENTSLQFNAQINKKKEFLALCKALEEFPYEKVQQLLNGEEIHVP